MPIQTRRDWLHAKVCVLLFSSTKLMKVEEMEVEFDVTCDISYQIMLEDIQNNFFVCISKHYSKKWFLMSYCFFYHLYISVLFGMAPCIKLLCQYWYINYVNMRKSEALFKFDMDKCRKYCLLTWNGWVRYDFPLFLCNRCMYIITNKRHPFVEPAYHVLWMDKQLIPVTQTAYRQHNLL